MAQIPDLHKLEEDSRAVFREDGMLYIFLGLLLLLFGGAFAVPALTGFVGFSAFLIYPVEHLRRRLTYPRLGYAKFSAPPGTIRGILIFAAVVVVVLFFLAFANGGRFQPILPLAFSIVFALSYYAGMSTHGVSAFDWIMIAVTLLAGLLATWRYSDWHDGAAALFAIMGLLLLAVGLVKLIRFLRKYPVLEQGNIE